MTFSEQHFAARGHSLDEYCAMFDLGAAERQLSILGVGDGPGSFNAEGTAAGMRIVSVDPLYALRSKEIARRPGSAVTQRFLDDYEQGIAQGRYVTGTVDALPFPDAGYDLALCSHLLFLHGARDDLAFHVQAIRELTRVAEEVRIFPLLEPGGQEPRHLRALMMALARMGLRAERRAVACRTQHGASEMLVISQ